MNSFEATSDYNPNNLSYLDMASQVTKDDEDNVNKSSP